MRITDPPVKHYPVTTSFWRGVLSPGRARGPVRRACDWRRASATSAGSFDLEPSCGHCRAYVYALRRLGRLRWP